MIASDDVSDEAHAPAEQASFVNCLVMASDCASDDVSDEAHAPAEQANFVNCLVMASDCASDDVSDEAHAPAEQAAAVLGSVLPALLERGISHATDEVRGL